ncbi:MAG: YbhB/YbcL family Raf kinase inhibitor-like protein [Candidatus Zambryskibacteria bacterium]|nr:YbhB/YbcL family Raf kinase inhibitor-like protein [Candidatus Zambryskibacteria bacterium]
MINIGDMKILKITSVAFEEGGKIPSKYTCDGENINPPFKIENIPPEAKSLALIADDPDAPSGVWVHWTVWNIDPNINKITEGNVPKGAIEGQTSFGNSGYGGPCPPSGSHHYLFKFYALDTKLDLPVETNNDELEGFIRNHLIASGGLTGIYERD